MRRFRHAAPVPVALFAAVVLSACEGAAAGTVGPMDPATLAEAATRVLPAELIADLGLDPAQQGPVSEEIAALHAAMLSLHEAMPADVESFGPEEREAVHHALAGKAQEVHDLHDTLMASLTDEQRQRFIEHIHSRMDATAGHGVRHEGGLHAIHDMVGHH